MTKEDAARQLDGWKLGSEMPEVMRKLLAENGLVAASLQEDNEICLDGALSLRVPRLPLHFTDAGEFVDHSCSNPECPNVPGSAKITVAYTRRPLWTFSSPFSTSPFNICMKNGDSFCRGIVFSLADLRTVPVSREMVFRPSTFIAPRVNFKAKRRTVHDDPWRNLLWLAGVDVEDMADVREVLVTMGEMKVKLKVKKKAPADMIGEI